MRKKPILLFASAWLLVSASALLDPSAALALPTFARKYETSCQTCHTAFPRLTPFGEAFRRNGYRFPAGEDEERSADEPVELGQPVHAKMFPDEVWPGELPGSLPLSAFIQAGATLNRGGGHGGHGAEPAVPDHSEEEGELGVRFAPAEAGLLAGGTFGERVSFFGKIEVSADGDVGLERPFVAFSLLEAPLWFLRVGMFEPSLYPFSVHRVPTGHTLAFTTVSFGDNGWAPEPQQLGLEMNGVLGRRFGWAAGLVEGTGGGIDLDKDAYGRIEYKLGGMSLDGTEPTGYNRPWQELSAALGASVYYGVGTLADPLGGDQLQSDRFWRASVDVQARLVDVTLTLAGFRQQHQRPLYGNAEEGTLHGAFAEAEYVAWPWLIPLARYEWFRQALPGVETAQGHRGAAGLATLIRANISARLFAYVRHEHDELELEEVSLAMQTAF